MTQPNKPEVPDWLDVHDVRVPRNAHDWYTNNGREWVCRKCPSAITTSGYRDVPRKYETGFCKGTPKEVGTVAQSESESAPQVSAGNAAPKAAVGRPNPTPPSPAPQDDLVPEKSNEELLAIAQRTRRDLSTTPASPVVDVPAGLPPDESPQRNAVCDALTEALLYLGELAYEACEQTTINLRDKGEVRGLTRLLTVRDAEGRDGSLGENTQKLWERIATALTPERK